MRVVSVVLMALGIFATASVVAAQGFGRVWVAAGSVGWGGFGLYVLFQLGLALTLGVAWTVLTPVASARVFVWGRMIRDAGGQVLPFTPIGGFVMGARAVTLYGVGWPQATAGTVADVTLEFLAEIVFVALGLAMGAPAAAEARLAGPVAELLLIGLGLGGMMLALQRRGIGLFRAFGRRLAPDWFDHHAAAIEAALAELWRAKRRVILGLALHLGAWLGGGAATWFVFRLAGVPIAPLTAWGFEALLQAAVTAGFAVPMAAGVQEGAYAALAVLFGVPTDVAVGLSLLRRAAQLTLGMPVLLFWQLVEVRRLRERLDPLLSGD